MRRVDRFRAAWWTVSVCVMVSLCGCERANGGGDAKGGTPSATAASPVSPQSKPVPSPAKVEEAALDQAKTEPVDEEAPEKPRDLGPPLVDDAKALKRLDPTQPVWIDAKQKQVVMMGETCRASYPLEFFATTPGREYEAVVVVRVKPSIVHAGLLAVGAKPGSTVKFRPEYKPPTGTEVLIEVRWKDKQGKIQQVPAQQWIRNIKTKKPLDVNWVFAGSGWYKDEETGREHYLGDGGDFISVLNLPTAVLDVPIPGGSDIDSRTFEGFVDNMPPQGTPVTIVLTPKLPGKPTKK